MKIKNLFVTALAVLGVVACQNKPSTAEGVTVDPTEIEFAKEGETRDVTITTADEWKLSVPEDLSWLEISEKKGTGTTKVTFKAPDNSDGFDRSGNITVKAGMYSAKIKVSQPGKGEKVDSEIEKLLAVELAKDEVREGAVDLKDVYFVAKSSKAAIISDGTAMILIYGAVEGAEIGDKGDLKGDLTVYSYRNQIKNATFTKTGTQTVDYGTPLNLNEVLDTYDWENARISYVHLKGTMRYDGSRYYNIFLDGRTKDVSLQYCDKDNSEFVDKVIEFNGFFVSGTNHVGVMPVGEIKVEGEAAPELKLSVSAKQTETGFEASWNEVAGATKYAWELLKGEAKVDGADVTATSVSKDVALEAGTAYTVKVKALNGSEELISATASFTARDMSGSAEEVTLTLTQEELAALQCNGAANALDGVITLTNSSDYGSNTVTELRIYKGKTMTISANGASIVSIEITCTANGVTKQGPGCWGAGAPEGYTFEEGGPKGSWAGNEASVEFTATDNQVRIKELTIIYAK